jgi:heat shock protein 90kDa beta
VVTSKNNEDEQYIWESDTASFSIAKDPRGSTLQRGSQISLKLKPEASDYLQPEAIKNLVKKYSQFINFPIYLWTSKTVEEEVPVDEETAPKEEKDATDDEDGKVEDDESKDDKPKTKKIEKTVWDWEMLNEAKPLWTRKYAF